MGADLLSGGGEPGRLRTAAARGRRLLGTDGQVVLAALLAVLVAGAAALPLPGPRGPVPVADGTRALPRVVLTQARVERVRPQPDGVLSVGLRLEGVGGLQVLSLRVDLPGSVVVLEALPDALSATGEAEVDLSLLPRCPAGVQGLSRGAVVAVVRRPGGQVREARVRLDPAGALPSLVRERCGTAGDPLDAVVAEPGGPAPRGLVRARALLSVQGRPVTVVGVAPGPGLAVDALGALPLTLLPGRPAVPLVVELRSKGCGGAPDTPPYLLLLDDGSPVAASVGPALRPAIDALRPYRCTTP